MDYNDVNARLRRIYASVDKQNRYGAEVLNAVHTEIIESPDKKGGRIIFSFGGGATDPDTINRINGVISNLANLKDCLKDKMVEQGKDKQLIEDDIGQSKSLQLVIDLANQEKHGYPLKETRRSKMDPLITNVTGALGPSKRPDGVVYSGSDGSMALNVMISVYADITDSAGKLVCTFDQMTNQAIADWEKIILKHHIV